MKENKASSTAFTVLQGFLYTAQSKQYGYLVSEEMQTLGTKILAASEEGRQRLQRLQTPWLDMSVKLTEFLLLPGITLHYVLRKRCIEDITRQAIADGYTQIINLGAGFDGLLWSLHSQHPQVNFLELDHPATHDLKVKALVEPATPADNIHFLSIDFTHQDLESVLNETPAFDAQRKTLFICEGVLMYLQTSEIDTLFNAIRSLSGQNTLFAFTCLEPQGSVNNNSRAALFYYLKLIGEPIKWALESEKMAGFLQQHKTEQKLIKGTEAFKQDYLKQPIKQTLHYGEYVVLTEFL